MFFFATGIEECLADGDPLSCPVCSSEWPQVPSGTAPLEDIGSTIGSATATLIDLTTTAIAASSTTTVTTIADIISPDRPSECTNLPSASQGPVIIWSHPECIRPDVLKTTASPLPEAMPAADSLPVMADLDNSSSVSDCRTYALKASVDFESISCLPPASCVSQACGPESTSSGWYPLLFRPGRQFLESTSLQTIRISDASTPLYQRQADQYHATSGRCQEGVFEKWSKHASDLLDESESCQENRPLFFGPSKSQLSPKLSLASYALPVKCVADTHNSVLQGTFKSLPNFTAYSDTLRPGSNKSDNFISPGQRDEESPLSDSQPLFTVSRTTRNQTLLNSCMSDEQRIDNIEALIVPHEPIGRQLPFKSPQNESAIKQCGIPEAIDETSESYPVTVATKGSTTTATNSAPSAHLLLQMARGSGLALVEAPPGSFTATDCCIEHSSWKEAFSIEDLRELMAREDTILFILPCVVGTTSGCLFCRTLIVSWKKLVSPAWRNVSGS
ncbi:unnamed protein product [Protopolystoma xenopodis]|uniref:Uncharacterized protein n=1 Tax=Protopolystoma xenopodis TaxID=117903 RepID=A0A3S5B0L3_9PLAT|nr:unnamed protein product [Protopolystoma xenopodis]